ncbi:MAG TPA: hypothetical protein VFG91_00130 [Woeseiaceae bacterium]|nr:hypothetical protein [Woeseiaceae bacterium]
MRMQKMQAGEDPGSVASALIYLLIGPLVWAGHLFLVYAPQSALCAFRITGFASIAPRLIEAVVVAVTVPAAVALLLAIGRPRQTARLFRAAGFLDGENGRFMVSVMRLLAALSFAGVLWAGATVLLLPACPQLR